MRAIPIVSCQLLLLLVLASCGDGEFEGARSVHTTYRPGEFEPASRFAARCENPRTGIDEWTGERWPDRAGSALLEKHFLRSWTHDLYLWFDEVVDRDPFDTGGASDGVLDYFDLLKTTATTPSGRAKDRFHFTYDTDVYRDLSSSGLQLGYGIAWSVRRASPPREVVVEYVQAGTEAAAQGVQRGALLLEIDGVDVVNDGGQADVAVINSALYSPAEGSLHTMRFQDRSSTDTRNVNLHAEEIAFDAVPTVSSFDLSGTQVGYLLFNDHTAAAESDLYTAVEQLDAAEVDELVLDLRYNGGGYLDVASELAYMIAGPTRTDGRTFELLQFNSQHPTRHPLTGRAIEPVPFHSSSQQFSLPAGTELPSLDLDRVYVLTSSGTCSASESVINSLRGVGIEVIQIGSDTCGKPYGFYAEENCGTTYFSIQFRGVNDLGFGDYADGFSATRTDGDPLANLPGCPAADDLTHELGDPAEGQLATALTHLTTGQCPAVVSKLDPRIPVPPQAIDEPSALRLPSKEPWRNNRIVR